ncbi:hypothetical protein ACFXKV_09225, partial [Streptomyces globisporus]|uniref:hypothetical protein n=1 Tax=Streptomyces globisporus TaxID=1908 RepID=UPI0036B560AB
AGATRHASTAVDARARTTGGAAARVRRGSERRNFLFQIADHQIEYLIGVPVRSALDLFLNCLHEYPPPVLAN